MDSILVVNASPLILLGRIGRLDLLSSLASRAAVPDSVLAELRAGAERDDVANRVTEVPTITVLPDVAVPQVIAAWDLGAGETQVLAHALEHPVCEAVLDDAAGRRCAASLNVRATGTVGLVLRAKKRGLLASARSAVEDLRRNGLYLSQAAADAALSLVDE